MIAFDPTSILSTPTDAIDTAQALLHFPSAGVVSGSIWASAATVPLAAMLYAASARGNGKGITWVLQAVDNVHEDTACAAAAGWRAAARYVGDQKLFRGALQRALDMDPRQRDSIVITMRAALSPWQQVTDGE